MLSVYARCMDEIRAAVALTGYVAVEGISPGCTGVINGSLGQIRRYVAADNTSAIQPCCPPPSVVSTVARFSRISCFNFVREV